jgi:hypothetical protein
MMRRSWFRLAIANATLGVASIIVAILADDPAIRWPLVGNAVASLGLAAWALRKCDGADD